MRDRRVLIAAAALLVVYAALFAALPPGTFYSPDEGAKYLQLRSLGWQGGVTHVLAYGGAALDPAHAFYPTHCRRLDIYPVRLEDGSVRLHWPIWFSLATWLPFQLFGLRGLYVVPLLSGWLVALCSGCLARRFDRRLAPLAILVVGLATPLAFFSQTYWEHTLATVLAVGALTVVAGERPRRAAPWLAALLLLAAVCLRVELVAFAVAMAIAWWLARRTTGGGAARRAPASRAWLAVYAGAIAAALAAASAFLPFRHRWMLGELTAYAAGTVAKLPHLPAALIAMLIDAPGHSAPQVPEWWRSGALVCFALAAVAPFVRPPRAATAIGLTAGLAALVFSIGLAWHPIAYMSVHGLLPAAPFVVLAAWAAPAVRRARRFDQRLIAGTAGLYLLAGLALLFTFTVEPSGRYRTGLEWGNRYLLPFYPLGAVLALAGVQAWRQATGGVARRLVTAVAAGLLWCGVQMEGRGLLVLHGSRSLVAEWQAAVDGGGPVVSDIWWLPAAMAPYFADRPMFCVRDGDDLAAWIAAVRARGTTAFTLASFRDLAPAGSAAAAAREVERVPVTGLRVVRYRLGELAP